MNDDQSIQHILEEFKKTGWVFGILGGLGMLARLILTDEKYNTTRWIRKVAAGTIVGIICYFSVHQTSLDPFYKTVLCSVSGSLSPELFNWLRSKFLQKAQADEQN
jgi:hypothetical protein